MLAGWNDTRHDVPAGTVHGQFSEQAYQTFLGQQRMTDQEVRRTVELVRDINKTKALIVVEHDMQFIRMIASKVTVFNQGAVLMEDDVEAIMHSPIVRDVYLGKKAAA